MVVTARRFAVAATAAVAFCGMALPATAAQAQGTTHTRVFAMCTSPQYRAHRYVLSCADANNGINHARYEFWGKNVAYGGGRYWFNDCKPTCADGHVHVMYAKFHLYRVVMTQANGPIFSRMALTTRTGRHHTFMLPTKPL